MDRIRGAAFDEKLSVIGLLISRLNEMFRRAFERDVYTTDLFERLKKFRALTEKMDAVDAMKEQVAELEQQIAREKKAEQLTKAQEHVILRILHTLETYYTELKVRQLHDGEAAFGWVKEQFAGEADKREEELETASQALDHAFDFMEKTFGDSQEMVIFITELNTDFYAVWFVDKNGCDRFYRYNKSLLFSERQKGIMQELTRIEEMVPIS